MTRHAWMGFAAWFGLAVAVVAAEPQDTANQLQNPGFEDGAGNALAAWTNYGRGSVVDRTVFHSGQQSVQCTARGDKDGMGVLQVIRYDKPDKRPIILGGWSKAENVHGGDYCVYLDILYDDGTPLWGQRSDWRGGTHDWEYNASMCHPKKPVKEIKAYVFVRNLTGTVWFDDIKVHRGGLHLTSVRCGSNYPASRAGLRIAADLTQKAEWQCVLTAAGQTVDTLAGSGNRIDWFWPRRDGLAPDALKITGKTPSGETVEHELRIPAAPPQPRNPVENGYAVWTRNSMQKIYPTERPPVPLAPPQASLTLARNEREGLQLAITPADVVTLKNLTVTVGALTNEAGDVFQAENIQWYVVGYIWVDMPSGHPLAPDVSNWCPEVLLPAKPFDVPGGRTQTVWLNVFAPETAKPGVYRGKVTVQPTGAAATDVPVTVRVRSFALPRAPRMKTAFAIMDGFSRHTYGTLTPELRRRGVDIMLEHRLNPDDISRTEPPPLEDLLYARDRGLNTFNILNLVPKPKDNPLWVCLMPLSAYGPGFTQELAARLDDYIAQLRKNDLAKMAHFYGFDERGEEYDELIKGICKFLKERYPEVSTFTTAGYMYQRREKTPPGYQDYMDWYCPLTPSYKPELSEKLRALGKQVWWYVCCVPHYPYANFASLDYPAIDGRLLGWMTYGYKADGLLYWHVNFWGDNKVIDSKDPYLEWKPTCLARMTDDGVLVYPAPQGPVSGIRLENIRDGIEDYDYLCLLAERKGRKAAMKYVDRLVKSMTEYSRDPAALYQVRDQIAAAIEGGN